MQLDKYQEQPQLLDPVLESFISPLISLLRSYSRGFGSEPRALERAILVSRLLNAVVTVRGYKTSLKFFGHEAADFEPAIQLLERLDQEDQAGRSPALVPADILEAGGGMWEAKRVLLLWLSILVRMAGAATCQGDPSAILCPLPPRLRCTTGSDPVRPQDRGQLPRRQGSLGGR